MGKGIMLIAFGIGFILFNGVTIDEAMERMQRIGLEASKGIEIMLKTFAYLLGITFVLVGLLSSLGIVHIR